MPTSTPTPPPEPLTDLHLHELGEEFLDALLSAADVDTVGRDRWWERARAALEAAAAGSTSWHQFVARAAAKLQIQAPNELLSLTVARLAATLNDPDTFTRFAVVVERDALTITAMVRAKRSNRRTTKPDTKPDTKPTPAQAPVEEQACLPF